MTDCKGDAVIGGSHSLLWCNPDCTKAKTLHVMGITRVLGHCGNSPNSGSDHMERPVPRTLILQIPEDVYPKQ